MMALEQHTEEVVAWNFSDMTSKSQLSNWKSVSAAVTESEDSQSASFECNICLETVQDPVVTFCGHLYCWPCIYKWLEVQGASSETDEPQPQQCPVCKSEVCTSALVPLYGQGRSSKTSKCKEHAKHLGIEIPCRPFRMVCCSDSMRTPTPMSYSPHGLQSQSYSQIHSPQMRPTIHHPNHLGVHSSSPTIGLGGTAASVLDPLVGMIGEMALERMSGSSRTSFQGYSNSYHLTESSSPRLRRHMVQADKSLSRVCFFFICCISLCLLLF